MASSDEAILENNYPPNISGNIFRMNDTLCRIIFIIFQYMVTTRFTTLSQQFSFNSVRFLLLYTHSPIYRLKCL